METVLGILPGLHSNKCVGIDIIALGSRLPEGLFTPGAWETFVAINLRVLPTEASVPRPHYVILYTKLCIIRACYRHPRTQRTAALVVFANRVGVIDCVLTNASILAQPCDHLVGRGGLELGDGLGALGDGVLGCVGNKFVIFHKNFTPSTRRQ